MTKELVNKGNILAEGENTGHAHRVTVQVMEREDRVREFEGTSPVTVTHEEHKIIDLPVIGRKWNSAQVREHDYVVDMERAVTD